MSAISELGKIRKAGKEEATDNAAGYLFLAPWLIGLAFSPSPCQSTCSAGI